MFNALMSYKEFYTFWDCNEEPATNKKKKHSKKNNVISKHMLR